MLNLIGTPKSYNRRAEKYAKKVAGYLKSKKMDYSVYFSLDRDDMIENINYLVSLGENEFVLIGDDRILSIFVNTVKDLSKIKLGLIPTSRRDDFAGYLNLSAKPVQAIKDIISGHINNVDILMCNNMRVVNNVVIGASVDVFEAYNKYKFKNFFTEKLACLKYTKAYTSQEYKINLKNSKARTADVFELIVANGGFSKGKKLSPLSNVKDGLFNLVYVKDIDRKMSSKSIRSIFDGEHIYLDNTVQLWGNEVSITKENQNIKAMLDGEVYNLERVDIQIKEGALKIYMAE